MKITNNLKKYLTNKSTVPNKSINIYPKQDNSTIQRSCLSTYLIPVSVKKTKVYI